MHFEKCRKNDRVSGSQTVPGLVPTVGVVSHGSESTLQVSYCNQGTDSWIVSTLSLLYVLTCKKKLKSVD